MPKPGERYTELAMPLYGTDEDGSFFVLTLFMPGVFRDPKGFCS